MECNNLRLACYHHWLTQNFLAYSAFNFLRHKMFWERIESLSMFWLLQNGLWNFNWNFLIFQHIFHHPFNSRRVGGIWNILTAGIIITCMNRVENLLWTLDSLEDLWHYLKKMPLCCSFVNAWLARPGTRTMPVIFLFIISHHDSSHPAVIGHCWFKYWYKMLCWWTSNSDMKRQMCLCSICLLLQLQQLGFSCLTKPLLLHQLRETVLCQCNIGVVN